MEFREFREFREFKEFRNLNTNLPKFSNFPIFSLESKATLAPRPNFLSEVVRCGASQKKPLRDSS